MLHFSLTKEAAQQLSELAKAGFDVVASDAYAEIEQMEQELGTPLRVPMFDLRRNDFTQGQAFWLFLTRDSVPVGGLAVKMTDLGDEPFIRYLARVSEARFEVQEPLAHMARPVASRLKGQIIEFGEMHLATRAGLSRGLLSAYGRLAVTLAAMNWPQFDWMYALVPPEQRAMAEVYGFEITTPRALSWNAPVPYPYANAQMMIYTSRLDFMHRIGGAVTPTP